MKNRLLTVLLSLTITSGIALPTFAVDNSTDKSNTHLIANNPFYTPTAEDQKSPIIRRCYITSWWSGCEPSFEFIMGEYDFLGLDYTYALGGLIGTGVGTTEEFRSILSSNPKALEHLNVADGPAVGTLMASSKLIMAGGIIGGGALSLLNIPKNSKDMFDFSKMHWIGVYVMGAGALAAIIVSGIARGVRDSAIENALNTYNQGLQQSAVPNLSYGTFPEQKKQKQDIEISLAQFQF